MKPLFYLSVIAFAHIGLAQNPKFCSQHDMQKQYLLDHPNEVESIEAAQRDLEAFTQHFTSQAKSRTASQYVIPIVFHILHDNGADNLSDQAISESVKRLNLDFNKRNADTTDVVAQFQSIIGDAEIEFRLAQLDPNGQPTTGIVRYETQETYNASDNVKSGRQWPRASYLNVYTARDIGGAAGYTYLPGSTNSGNDAIMMLYNYLGPNSRTLTHEIGHWLNLNHCWGWTNDPALSSNCNSDDNVSDTPNTIGWQQCDLAGTSCNSLDNVQNYMEYSYCSNMFTKGQVTRMHAALNSSTAQRNNLGSPNNLANTGVDQLAIADFSSNNTVVCAGEAVSFEDISQYGQTDWQWSFPGGSPASSTSQHPNVIYTTPGVYSVTLTVNNGSVTLSKSKTDYILVVNAQTGLLPVVEGFENGAIPNQDWLIENPDQDANYWQYTSSTSYSGSACAKMNNINNTAGNKDDLISKAFDLSNLATGSMTFKLAFAQRGAINNDALRVYASYDCGENWYIRWSKSGDLLATVNPQFSVFTPSNTTQWREETVSLPASFLQDDVLFKFTFESDAGNNLYLDDININGTFNPIPVLEWPENGATGISSNPTVNWKAVGNIDYYEYQIATDATFTSLIVNGSKSYITPLSNGSDTEHNLNGLTPNQTYYWRVRSVTAGAPSNWSQEWSFTVSATGVFIESIESKSTHFTLAPNPSNGSTLLSTFVNNKTSASNLELIDMLGRRFILFENRTLDIGKHSFPIDVSSLKPGVYFVKLSIDGESCINKLIVQ